MPRRLSVGPVIWKAVEQSGFYSQINFVLTHTVYPLSRNKLMLLKQKTLPDHKMAELVAVRIDNNLVNIPQMLVV